MGRLISLVAAVSLIVVFFGCGGSSSSSSSTGGGSTVKVAVKPGGAQLGAEQKQPFSATVTGTSNTAVAWTVSGGGSIDGSGLYTAPAVIPSQTTATITATSQADSTKSANASITLLPITVTVSPASQTLYGLAGQQQFSAQLTETSNHKVTWSVVPGTCGSNCGTIDSSTGLYTAPVSVTPATTAMVTATSQADPTKSNSATVTLLPPALSGPYVFFFQGTDANGLMQEAGYFFANRDGTINNDGVEDIVRGSGASTKVSFTASYAIDLDNDGRGTLTITPTGGVPRTFSFNMNAGADRVHYTEINDGSGIRGAGTLERQDATALTAFQSGGDYAFGLSGADGNPPATQGHYGAVGRFHVDGIGGISVGDADTNDAGIVVNTPNFSGSYTAVDPNTGRGTALLYNGLAMAFYIVSASESVWLTIDVPGVNHPIAGGRALQQTGAGKFDMTSLSGAPTVFYLSGANGTAGTGTSHSDVVVGVLAGDGSGKIVDASSSDPSQMDENNGVSSSAVSTMLAGTGGTGTYTVTDATSGRGTISLPIVSRNLTFYLVGANTAFLLDSIGAVAATGFLEIQTVGECGCSTLAGVWTEGSIAPATQLTRVESGSLMSTTKKTGTLDGWNGAYIMDQPYTHTFSLQKFGRGTMTRTGTGTENWVFYMITKTRGIAIASGTEPQPAIQILEK